MGERARARKIVTEKRRAPPQHDPHDKIMGWVTLVPGLTLVPGSQKCVTPVLDPVAVRRLMRYPICHRHWLFTASQCCAVVHRRSNTRGLRACGVARRRDHGTPIHPAYSFIPLEGEGAQSGLPGAVGMGLTEPAD